MGERKRETEREVLDVAQAIAIAEREKQDLTRAKDADLEQRDTTLKELRDEKEAWTKEKGELNPRSILVGKILPCQNAKKWTLPRSQTLTLHTSSAAFQNWRRLLRKSLQKRSTSSKEPNKQAKEANDNEHNGSMTLANVTASSISLIRYLRPLKNER